jgi:hypothetical protein
MRVVCDSLTDLLLSELKWAGDNSSILLQSQYLQRDTSLKNENFWNFFSISLHQVATFPWLYTIYPNITVKCFIIKNYGIKTYLFIKLLRCRYLDRRSIKQAPDIYLKCTYLFAIHIRDRSRKFVWISYSAGKRLLKKNFICRLIS